MSTYRLNAAEQNSPELSAPESGSLGNAVLVHNVRWFIELRWIVIAALAAAGMLFALAPDPVRAIGIDPQPGWLWSLSAVLAAANVLFMFLSRRLTAESLGKALLTNTALQTLVDLLVLTVLVHFVGSTNTFVSFVYVFHVALACIFFPWRRSLAVALLASGLFLSCVSLEITGIIKVRSIVLAHSAGQTGDVVFHALSALSAVFVWLVIWYLVSSLAAIVRKRDQELEQANEKLAAAAEEKNRLMLHTAHDLKAPFSGIESNIALLKMKHSEELTERASDIIGRIVRSSQSLRTRIGDILVLGGLRMDDNEGSEPAPVDLRTALVRTATELEDRAAGRNCTIGIAPGTAKVIAREKKLDVLFANLMANAVSYSHEGGTVRVTITRQKDGVHVSIADDGIGIEEDALGHIFDEYFRTPKAAVVNQQSTGLGLAIVKEVAVLEQLDIAVSSEVGKGTTFEIIFPAGIVESGEEGTNNMANRNVS